LRLGRRQKIILAVTGCAFFAIVLVVVARRYWPLGRATLEVSREITYLTGPLNADGTVDYLSVVEAEMSAGVTRKDNAAVLMLRALGPDFLTPTMRSEALSALGLESLPERGAYFRPYNDFLLAGGDAKTRAKSVDLAASQVLASTRAPWTRAQHSRLADWIDGSAPALDLLVEASSRDHLHFPVFSLMEPARISQIEPAPRLVRLRLAAQALASRALLRAGSGEMVAAWKDVVAILRLARLMQHGLRRIELTAALGMEIEGALRTAKAILASKDVPAAIAVQALRELEATPAPPLPGRAVRLERLLTLDIFQSLWSEARAPAGSGQLDGIDGHVIDPAAFVVANRVLDEVEEALAAPSLLARIERVGALDRAHRRRLDESSERTVTGGFRAFASAAQRRYALTEHLLRRSLTPMLSALASIVYIRGRADVDERLVRIGLHLEMHRHRDGEYPRSLDLLPAELRDDPFIDGALRYRREEGGGYTLLSVGVDGVEGGGNAVGSIFERDLILRKSATAAD